jgi:hypothetical protein
MSRFKKFQGVKVFDENNEPLNEQIFVNNFIINFKNGFINNCDKKHEGFKDSPAINFNDGYIEYWKNGEFISNLEFYDKIKNYEEPFLRRWEKAEFAFAEYLDNNIIPFIYLNQPEDSPYSKIYSKVFLKKNIRKPDFLVFFDNKPLFIDVKARSLYSIDKEDLEKLNALKNEYLINVLFAIIDINKIEQKKFRFLSLDVINDYIEIIKNNNNNTLNWFFYFYSESLLKEKIIINDIDKEDLKKIYFNDKSNKNHCLSEKQNDNSSSYSDILENYLDDNGFNYKT